ncbi:MAG: hypothetical protein RBR40_06345 [Tenuifilaceae bacterium]|nr:hypothetical protein [Tenuifilaceae bacterium]
MKNSKIINKISISVGDETFVINVGVLLHIDENNIENEAESTLANFGYFSTLKAKLGRVVSDIQLQVTSLYSELFLDLKRDEESRISDRYAESYANNDEDYQELVASLNKAKEHLNIITGIAEALKLKINVIQTISANLRKS